MLIPRLKVLILALVSVFFQSQPTAQGSFWLQFGQIAAITYIAWLVIKRGAKAGDQDVAFWTTFHNSHYDKLEQQIKELCGKHSKRAPRAES